MLDIGWQELMLVCVVVVIVVGPKELPRAVRGVAGFMRKVRAMTNEFQNSLTGIADEHDMLDIKKDIDEVKKQVMSASADDPTGFGGKLKKFESEQKKMEADYNASLDFSGSKAVKKASKKKKAKKATKKTAKKLAKKVAKKTGKIKPPSLRKPKA